MKTHTRTLLVTGLAWLTLPATAQLSGLGTQFWRSGLAGINSPLQADAELGAALAAGDFNCDGFDDLAIGVPRLDLLVVVEDAGSLLVLYGGPGGLGTAGSQFFDQITPDLPEAPEVGDLFATALVAGNFNGDNCDDLAVGIPFEDIGAEPGALTNAGAVTILEGAPGGLEPGIYINQDSDFGGPIAGVAEDDDRFGSALAAADFDGDGFGELAIGIPRQGDGAPEPLDHGAVVVHEIDTSNSLLITQSILGPDQEEAFDLFGSTLAGGDFDADGYAELVIGVPSENLGGLIDAGMVHVIPSTVGGFDLDGAVTWLQALDPSDDDDLFGRALAVGRFGGNAGFDLAIGVPGEQLGAAVAAGGVNVLYSRTLFRDGFESGDLSGWDLVVP